MLFLYRVRVSYAWQSNRHQTHCVILQVCNQLWSNCVCTMYLCICPWLNLIVTHFAIWKNWKSDHLPFELSQSFTSPSILPSHWLSKFKENCAKTPMLHMTGPIGSGKSELYNETTTIDSQVINGNKTHIQLDTSPTWYVLVFWI